MKKCLIVISSLLLSFNLLSAASPSDSVLEIPKGTLFKLRYELEIPANRNFILLGYNQLNENFNEVNKMFNQQNGNRYAKQGYFYYTDYLDIWLKTADESYQDCLKRHRVVYSYGGSASTTNNTIINQGQGNTNIIINKNTYTAPSYGSYIGDNTCMIPEHTLAVLMLDKDKAGSGGIFRDGYVFKVYSVKHETRGRYHIVNIRFDHEIAKGIQIITTVSPETITMNQLQYRESGDGFWQGVGSALGSLIDIGGNHFTIELPELHYYK